MITDLLFALNGIPGDLFYPIMDDGSRDSNGEWRIAPSLMEHLHPAEERIVSKLLSLAGYVRQIGDFTKMYGSFALFSNTIASAGKTASKISNERKAVSADGENVAPFIGNYAACLSGGMTEIMDKYSARLVDLEKRLCNWKDENNLKQLPSLLSHLYAELQPYFQIFPVLGRIQTEIRSSNITNGGGILSVVCETYEREWADNLVRDELRIVLRHCLMPFRSHLMVWLTYGRLETDKWDEFFVQEKRGEGDDASQSGKKIILLPDAIPPFLGEATAEKILFIGKSVKLLLESSLQSALDDWKDHVKPLECLLLLPFSNSEVANADYDSLKFELEKRIELIRRAAAEKLYKFLFEKTNAKVALDAWLRNTFFLGRGELFLAFIDIGESVFPSAPIAADQLDKKTLLLTKCWSEAMEKIHLPNYSAQDYFTKITPYFDPASFSNGSKVLWDVIQLRLDVPQQLLPIFTSKFVSDLNEIFVFLLRWRRTQTLLESCWLKLKKSPISVIKSLPSLETIHQLISLMIHVVKNFQYYIHADVLETAYLRTIADVTKCRDFELLLKALHGDMINEIRIHCFLGGNEGHGKMGKLLRSFQDECDSFSLMVVSRINAMAGAKKGNDASPISNSGSSQIDDDGVFAARVHDAYVNLQRKTALLFKILTTVKGHDAFLNRLLLRLDFNNYFSNIQMF